MKELRHLSMEEFRLELEQLASEGMKFDVKSQGTGNIYLSIPGCDVSVYQENGEICGEIIITKPEENMKFTIDFDAVDLVFSEGDMKYCLQMESDMCMSDIEISKPEANMKFTIDFDAVDLVFKENDTDFYLQMESNMCMSDIVNSATYFTL